MSWNPQPTLGAASWQGNPPLVTKKQLLSTTQGLLNDIQDINLSTINVQDLSVSTFDGSLVSVSTLQFKGIDLGGVSFSFDLGLGNAIGGFLGGLGALVGGAFIGLGTGTGLAIQGITNGLFSLANTQGGTQINSNVFETINGSTQLQISTLGNAYPLYSSIFRQVSSLSPNSIPGQEIFVSTFFNPGTTCVRSVSDPIPILTNNSTINTSTIQSFGEWVPFLDPTQTGEDIFARNAQFSTLVLSNNYGGNPIFINTSNTTGTAQILNLIKTPATQINCNVVYSDARYSLSQREAILAEQTSFNRPVSFISTAYAQYTSTIGNSIGGVFFVESTITNALSTIPKFTYVGTGIGNFAICEFDESNFLSSFTLDVVAQSDDVVVQWGLAVQNRNSTIGLGTSRRVTYNNTSNTSNIFAIPGPPSTIASNATGNTVFYQRPLESMWEGTYSGSNPQGGMAFNINRATFGSDTTFCNVPTYPYQFNGNLYVNGTVEALEVISLSTFTSTNVVTYFSTVQLDADIADIEQANISSLSNYYMSNYFFSSFTIDNYRIFSQFSFISTSYIDLQLFAEDNATCYLQKIVGSNNAFINTTTGIFDNLSTNVLQASNTVLTPFVNCFSLSSFNTSTVNLRANSITASNFITDTISISTLTTSNATLGTANIGGGTAQFSTATISSIVFSSLSGTHLSLLNLNVSSINNSTSIAYVSSYNVPQFIGNTTGFPGQWIKWFALSTSKFQLQQPSLDYHIDGIGVIPNNGVFYNWAGYIGVAGENFLTSSPAPSTHKFFFGFPADGTAQPLSATFCLKYGTDYDSNSSQLQVQIQGAANNPIFEVQGPANVQIRAYPF